MGLDRAPIEFQTFYFFHVWLDPPIAQHRFRDNANMKAFDVVDNYNAVAILALVALK